MPSEILLPRVESKAPRCAMCRTRMDLNGREVDTVVGEKLTFRCPKCDYVKTKTAVDARNAELRRAASKAPRRRQARQEIGRCKTG